MIRYYHPNLSLSTALRVFGGRSGEEEIRRHFRRLTGKRHILLTSSCRAALYLTYTAMEDKGEVLVSPLTCAVAVLPIVMAGHTLSYVDIDPVTLNMDPDRLPESIFPDTRAIQTINLGGNPCEMDRIAAFAERHGLLLVEDCAQGFGSSFEGRPLGSFGEVACFTLSKNAYGIGGGVLATDNESLFQRAKEIQDDWPPISRSVLLFRTLRGVMESRSSSDWMNHLHDALLRARSLLRKGAANGSTSAAATVSSLLRRPRAAMFRIGRRQLRRTHQLHEQRMAVAYRIIERLETQEIRPQRPLDRRVHHAVCKLFVRVENLPRDALARLAGAGIDAKHLEQKHVASIQDRFDCDRLLASPSLDRCPVYQRVHDELISLPLSEAMQTDEIRRVAEAVAGLRNRGSSVRRGAAPQPGEDLAAGTGNVREERDSLSPLG
jgi:dTDP-4-amino-4,6-dideoxygalactose transaminase